MIESLVLALVSQPEAGEGEAGQDSLVPEAEGLPQLGFYRQNLRLAPGSSLSVSMGWTFSQEIFISEFELEPILVFIELNVKLFSSRQ